MEEQRVKTASLAAEMADDYQLIHKSKFGLQHQFQPVRDTNWENKSSGGKGKGDHVGDNKDCTQV